MSRKNVLIGLTIALTLLCIVPVGIGLASMIIENMPEGSGKDVVQLLAIVVMCCLPIVLAFGGLGWTIYHNTKSRKTAVNLSESLGLNKISKNETSPMKTWYGGVHNGRSFAIKPVAFKGSSYFDGRKRSTAEFYLRVVMEVPADAPMGIVVYRRPSEKGGAESFEEAFPTLKNASYLSGAARGALLGFAQKGYETGLKETTYRTEKGVRNLTLRDRAGTPEEQLSREVMPNVHVILAHDHPYPNINSAELTVLLDELTAVCHAIES